MEYNYNYTQYYNYVTHNYTNHCKTPFFIIEKVFVTETLDENFSSKYFSHLKFFFTEEFQNKILTKIFHKI